MKFDGAAFKNLEGLNVGIPDFLPTKYIHQLSTPYPISGTLFGFEIGWLEPKLRDKVLGPKRGP